MPPDHPRTAAKFHGERDNLASTSSNTPRGDKGFVTAAVVDPFGNVLGIMHNPHYLEILKSSGRA
jgi:hypothetical protein